MGKLFQFTIKDIVEIIEGRINNEFDCLLVIDGNRGLGKSTLAFKICPRLKLGIPFVPTRDIIYDKDTALKHIATKKKGVIFLDEAIGISYNRDFYTETQKQILKALNMYRDSGNLVIFCVPAFADLDVQLRELCSMRITILKRGIALVQKPRPSLYDKDKWSVKSNSVIEKKWGDTSTKNPKYSQLSTAIGILVFGDLTEQQKIIYKAIKQDKRNRLFGKYGDDRMMIDEDTLFIKKLVDKVKSGKMMPETLKTICEINGKNERTIRAKINDMLKKEGIEVTTKELVKTNKARVKRDLLGFVVPESKTNTSNNSINQADSESEL
jgi:hypothetical protein